MKSLFTRTSLIIVVLIFLSAGCSILRPIKSNDLQKSFEEMISISNMNSDMKVTVMEVNRHEFGVDIQVLIQNLGDNPIYFSIDENDLYVRVFTVRNNEWVKMQNTTTYVSVMGGDGFTVMPDNTDQPNLFSTSVRPVFETETNDNSKDEFIRILIVGELMIGNQKMGIPVGAYVDLYVER